MRTDCPSAPILHRLACALVASALALPLAAQAQAPAEPAPLAVEDLGEPVRTMRQCGSFLIPKPDAGGWWYVASYNPQSRNALSNQMFVVDLDTKAVTVAWGPTGGGLTQGWNNQGLMGPDGLFYLGHYGRAGLYAFHPSDGTIEWLPFDAITARLVAFQMRLSDDRKIFIGTCSAEARVYEFDIATRAFRDLGMPAPLPAPTYVWSMAVSASHIYCGIGKNPWRLTATDRATGAHTRLLADLEMDYLEVQGAGNNCLATVKLAAADGGQPMTRHFRLADGQATACEGPAPGGKAAAPTPVPPEVLTTLARPTSTGNAQIWWRPAGGTWDHLDLAGIQTMPWEIECLRGLPDGRLLGAPRAYEDFFTYDPASGAFAIPGKSPLSASAVECAGGRIYLLGYPGTLVFDYDPARPWTFFTTTPEHKEPALDAPESNPRQRARLGDAIQTHHVIGSAIAADGRIYVGAHAERLSVGGGLAWYDPATGESGGLRAPFELQDCAGLCAAMDGRRIVYASHPVSDPRGKAEKPAEAKLFVFDVDTRALSAELAPVPGLKSCGRIAAVGARLFGSGQTDAGAVFYVVDLTTGKTLLSSPLPAPMGPDLKAGPDGRLYTFVDRALTRIDPDAMALATLGAAEHPTSMEFVGGDLYLAVGASLRRIKDVARLAP